jgi:HAL2 family 3'(2'),5'-bisphosphate nucleotidase
MKMTEIDLRKELEIAIEAVRAAAGICRRVQGDLVSAATLEKNDRSPVTVADFASQALVCARLAEGSAVSAIVAEESAGPLREPGATEQRDRVLGFLREARGPQVSPEQVYDWIDRGAVAGSERAERYWTLDPIDGTKGFLRGGQYAIALGLIERGEVLLAALCCPNLDAPDGSSGAVLSAIRGQGAVQQALRGGPSTSVPVRVSEIDAPSQARFCESFESGHSDQQWSARVASRLGITLPPVRVDSQAKYALLARGEASIYLRLPTRKDYREKIWDHAAGMLIVQEAGGTVTDVDGKPLDFTAGRTLERNRGVIATGGKIHRAVVEAVGGVLSGS